MTVNIELFKAGKMPREQLFMPPEAYVQIDQWIDYLKPEQYYWWRKFISWVDRSESRTYEFHVPYTIESVYEKLGVSKSHFYKKIKTMWECGLIELVEFEKSERKTTKPRNIIVYNYPFNKKEFQYEPLEKRRDWITEYESQAKIHGYTGVLKAREIRGLQMETVEQPVDNSPETVDKPVDNSIVDNVDKGELEGLQMETVEGLQMETVRVSKQRPINITNNLLIPLNNSINNSNNSSLSKYKIDVIKEMLKEFGFTAGERDRIIELLIKDNIYGFCKEDIKQQARYMLAKNNIRDRAVYFVNGLVKNIGREYPKPRKIEETPYTGQVPFYNWLEE